MRRSMYDKLKVTQVLAPAVYNSDQNCSSVDMQGYNSVEFLVLMGNSADTLNGTNKIELELEESSDDASFSDVADADIQDAVDATNDGSFGLIDAPAEDTTVFRVSYIGESRYVRPVINFSGTHATGTPIGVVAIQAHAEIEPVS